MELRHERGDRSQQLPQRRVQGIGPGISRRRQLPLRGELPQRHGGCLRQELRSASRSVRGAFVDSTIPSGFAPFNVVNVGNGKLAVTYAKQDAAKHDDVAGPGNGYVTIYDTSGNLMSRLAHTPYLNSPWAVVVAPASGFGGFGGDYSGWTVRQRRDRGLHSQPAISSDCCLIPPPCSCRLTVCGDWDSATACGRVPRPRSVLHRRIFDEAHGIFGSITCCSTGPLTHVSIIKK